MTIAIRMTEVLEDYVAVFGRLSDGAKGPMEGGFQKRMEKFMDLQKAYELMSRMSEVFELLTLLKIEKSEEGKLAKALSERLKNLSTQMRSAFEALPEDSVGSISSFLPSDFKFGKKHMEEVLGARVGDKLKSISDANFIRNLAATHDAVKNAVCKATVALSAYPEADVSKQLAQK